MAFFYIRKPCFNQCNIYSKKKRAIKHPKRERVHSKNRCIRTAFLSKKQVLIQRVYTSFHKYSSLVHNFKLYVNNIIGYHQFDICRLTHLIAH
jgi:hypothetical protein